MKGLFTWLQKPLRNEAFTILAEYVDLLRYIRLDDLIVYLL